MDAAAGVVIDFPPLPDQARCLKCGYLLRGLTEPRFPECGRVFDPADGKSYTLHSPPHWLLRICVTALSRFVFWGAVALTVLAAVTSAMPGLWGPGVLVGLAGTMMVIMCWVVLLGFSVVHEGLLRRAPLVRARTILVPMLCALLCVVLLVSNALSPVALAIAKPAMNRLAAEALKTPSGTTLPDRWLGIFRATSIETFLGGFRFTVDGAGIAETRGYAYSTVGTPPVADEEEYVPVGDGWYSWIDQQ